MNDGMLHTEQFVISSATEGYSEYLDSLLLVVVIALLKEIW